MLRKSIVDSLDTLAALPTAKLLSARYDKFRAMGVFSG
jgi:acetyl-CoA carboxylase alpha subunit